jgi:purine-binding chemotaxis protein CheW
MMMNSTGKLVTFQVSGQALALPLETVLRVHRAVEITPLPQAPEIVLGIVNLAGEIFPVMNMRRRLGFSERPIQLSDELILARTARRSLALLVDSVGEVLLVQPGEGVSSESVVPGLDQIRGILQRPDGLILIQDLDRFLSLEEEQTLTQALRV